MTGLCTLTLFTRTACNEFLLGHSPFITLFKHDLQRPIEMTPQGFCSLRATTRLHAESARDFNPFNWPIKTIITGLQQPCSHEPDSQYTVSFRFGCFLSSSRRGKTALPGLLDLDEVLRYPPEQSVGVRNAKNDLTCWTCWTAHFCRWCVSTVAPSDSYWLCCAGLCCSALGSSATDA